MSLPGTRLFELSTRYLDQSVVESVVVPTIADMQHEFLQSGASGPRRALALLRGYAAIARVLVWHGLLWRSPMRRVLSVLVLGAAASGLVIFLDQGADTTLGLGVLSLVTMAASVAFRFRGPQRTYRQVFASCLGFAMIVGTALFAWVFIIEELVRRPWYSYALLYAMLIAWAALTSAMAAAVAWRPALGAEPGYRRRLVQITAASATFAVCFVARTVVPSMRPRGGFDVLTVLGYSAYVACLFAVFALAVYLPVISRMRRALPQVRARLPIAAVGAALFPIPLLGVPILHDSLPIAWPPSPWHFALPPAGLLPWMSIPYVVAGAVRGWMVADRPLRAKADAWRADGPRVI